MLSTDLTHWIGKTLAEVDTPSLLLDADALSANIRCMAAFFAGRIADCDRTSREKSVV